MTRRLRLLLLLLPVVVVAALPGAALGAKTRTRVEPARTWAFIKVRGTHGWTVQITGTAAGSHGDSHPIGVYAKGPEHGEVGYVGFPGRFTSDGRVVARLPGVGRINLRYEPTSHDKVNIGSTQGCTSAPTTIDSKGIFRGTIELRGEGGFTTVDAHSARGELSTYPKQTCPVRPRSKAQFERQYITHGGGEEQELYAIGKSNGGTVTFSAWGIPGRLEGLPPRIVEFAAEYSRRERGMLINASTRIEGASKGFTVSPSSGSPSEATVAPGAPFAGSAEFDLLSTTASWTGDLRAPIPTLGTVELTGSTFESSLCVGLTCTKTAPGLRRLVSVPIVGSD